MKPWLVVQTPTGRVWHVVQQYRYVSMTGGREVVYSRACRTYEDRRGLQGDIRMVDNVDGPVCVHCLRRVRSHAAWVSEHRDRLVAMAERHRQ